jgi:hypothetical protein
MTEGAQIVGGEPARAAELVGSFLLAAHDRAPWTMSHSRASIDRAWERH